MHFGVVVAVVNTGKPEQGIDDDELGLLERGQAVNFRERWDGGRKEQDRLVSGCSHRAEVAFHFGLFFFWRHVDN